MSTAVEKTTSWKKTLLSALGGAAFGAASVSALIWLGGDELLKAMNGSRVALAAVGLFYVLISAMLGFGLVAPGAGAKVLNVADAEELIDERPKLLRSILLMLVFGLAFMLLALSRGPDFAEGPVSSAVGLAALVAVFLISVVSFRWMGLYDELDFQLGYEGSAWAFFIAAVILIPWAALDALGWNVTLQPLDVVTVMAVALVAGPFAVIAKRGMMVR